MMQKDSKVPFQSEEQKQKRIRVTITGRNAKAIEKFSEDMISTAKEKQWAISGPRRMPVKTLRVTTRKSPCGEGTNTWDKFEMKLYKHVIDLQCHSQLISQIATLSSDPSIDVEITISNSA